MPAKGYLKLISFEEAKTKILETVVTVKETDEIKIVASLNRILAVDIIAPFDIPSHNDSAMDGYAIQYEDISEIAPSRLKVIGELPAGGYFDKKIEEGQAVRIMTGATLPEGADTVVIQEVTGQEGEWVTIPPKAAKKWANIRFQGEDIKQGNLILDKGTWIKPQEMGMLAAMGYTTINAFRKLTVAIASTGDELLLPGEKRPSGKKYDSNRYTLMGLLTQLGVEIIDLSIIRDDKDVLKKKFAQASNKADAIITSGGVSVGQYDLVKEVVNELGNLEFWQVNVKPGKPVSFGKIGNCYFFGLPGNPVSVMVSFIKFVRCALLKMAGYKDYDKIIQFKAKAKFQRTKKDNRTEFLRGILSQGKDGWEVTTTGPQGSGILSSMLVANCLMMILPEQNEIREGDEVWVEPFRMGY